MIAFWVFLLCIIIVSTCKYHYFLLFEFQTGFQRRRRHTAMPLPSTTSQECIQVLSPRLSTSSSPPWWPSSPAESCSRPSLPPWSKLLLNHCVFQQGIFFIIVYVFVFVVHVKHFKIHLHTFRCPHCHQQIVTQVSTESGCCAYVGVGVCLLLGKFWWNT